VLAARLVSALEANDTPLSTFAFNINLRRYTVATLCTSIRCYWMLNTVAR